MQIRAQQEEIQGTLLNWRGISMSVQNTTQGTRDLSAFAGRWINTNEGTSEVSSISLRIAGDRIYMGVTGNTHPAAADWSEIEVRDFYADSVTGQIVSFTTTYTCEALSVEFGVNLNQGLLVVAMFNSWNDGERTDYFAREFFHI
jgi:hypothetical protein